MARSRIRSVAGGFTLVGWMLCGWNGPAAEQPAAIVVTPAELAAIVKESIKPIKQALAKPKDKTSANRIRTNAFVIALAAQNAVQGSGPDAQKAARLRDAALELAADTDGKQIKDVSAAARVAKVIAAYPEIDTHVNGSNGPVDLLKQFDMADIMRTFDKPVKGGQGIELQLITLSNVRRVYKPAQMAGWHLSALKTALLAHAVSGHDPGMEAAKKKQWHDFSEDMERAAYATMGTASNKDSKLFKLAIKKLNDTCTACHDVFK